MARTSSMTARGDHTRTKKTRATGFQAHPADDAVGEFAPIPDDIQSQVAGFLSAVASFAPTSTPAPAFQPENLALSKPTEKPDLQKLLDAARAGQNQPANNMLSAQQGQQSQAPAAGGLFGAAPAQSTNNTTTSLFGGGNTNNSTQQNQPASTSIFGNNTSNTGGLGATNNTSSSSIFGNTNNTASANNMFAKPATTQAAPAGGSLFGAQSAFSNNNNNNSGSSLFDSTARPQQQQAPSLLGATQTANLNHSTPFGRLSMGQNAAAPAGQAASQVTIDNLKGTTRFEDCADSVKQELESLDRMIQQQEQFAKQIEAFLPKHEENVNSLLPDINFVKDKADDVEQSLATDAQGVDAQRKNAERDLKDGQRLQRIVTNLALPQPYQYPNLSTNGLTSMYTSQQRSQQPQATADGEETYDTDLIGNYFLPMATELQRTMDSYASNLTEIEQHMRVIENSTVQQAQQLAQRRSGIGGAQPSSEDTVRELASTLRGFEESILGVAGIVGECREGVTQLALGRLGSHLGGGVR